MTKLGRHVLERKSPNWTLFHAPLHFWLESFLDIIERDFMKLSKNHTENQMPTFLNPTGDYFWCIYFYSFLCKALLATLPTLYSLGKIRINQNFMSSSQKAECTGRSAGWESWINTGHLMEFSLIVEFTKFILVFHDKWSGRIYSNLAKSARSGRYKW